jgi:hypothetical protein
MRRCVFALALSAVAAAASAQEDTIVIPEGNFGNYDPTLSAKEAVLANWELAASGIQAGRVLGSQVAEMAGADTSYDALVRQARFAQKTILARYYAASWVYAAFPEVDQVEDATLRAIVAAPMAPCASDCGAEIDAVKAAYETGAAQMAASTEAARQAIIARQGEVDAVLLAEQLGLMASYLESASWAEDMVLTEYGMDGAVLADRLVGTLALWRNIEPYVGITSPEIDDTINAASQNLLRTLRRGMRDMDQLEADSAFMTDLTAAADALAVELRRAAALFSA